MMFKLFLLTLGLCQLAFSKVYFWDVTWVNAAPDGYSRPVIGINGKWPCPSIDVEVGERVTVILNNKLGNQSTGLHFHGITQFGTGFMDGASSTTQCPVPPGSTFTYSFIADRPGTYWYHSHNMGQYPDGLRGPLIVHDPNSPWKNRVAKEYVMTVTDWYHDQMPNLIHTYQSVGAANIEPIPDSVMINDGQGAKYNVEPGKTYLFRIIHMGAFPSFFINFEEHNMTVVEMDSVYTEDYPAATFYTGAAMRYSVLVTAKTDATRNYGILALGDNSMFRAPPAATYKNATFGTLVYDEKYPQPAPHKPVLPPIDDAQVKPLDQMPLLGPVTKQWILDFKFGVIDGVQRALINNITYLNQKVPTLYTALSVGKQHATDMRVYGVNANPFRVDAGDVVEIVLNNYDNNGHPWHLHGHQFQVVARSSFNALPASPYNASTPLAPIPMRRDTVGVRNGGYTVLRFKADNPGTHLIHCHIEWHVESGLSAVVIEAADKLDWQIPFDHKLACMRQGMPYQGNAAGNTQDVFNLEGANDKVNTENFGALYDKRSAGGTSNSSPSRRDHGGIDW